MQIGILLPNLGPNQLSFTVLHQVGKITDNLNLVPILFQRDVVTPVLTPMCAVLNVAEIFSFKGLLVTTNLEDTYIALKNAKMTKDKILYLWDLEWLRNNKNYLQNMELYNSTKIITQNKYHADAIRKYAGVNPIGNVEQFDLEKIANEYFKS